MTRITDTRGKHLNFYHFPLPNSRSKLPWRRRLRQKWNMLHYFVAATKSLSSRKSLSYVERWR